MQIPDKLIQTGVALNDRFFDLKGLAVYSCMGVSSLRYHIKENGLPCYSVRGERGQVSKILVKLSEFDRWMERWRDGGIDINQIVDDVLQDLQSDKQSVSHRPQNGSRTRTVRKQSQLGAVEAH